MSGLLILVSRLVNLGEKNVEERLIEAVTEQVF